MAMPTTSAARAPEHPPWPPGLTRVPFWVYQDPALRAAEQDRCSKGRCGIICAWKWRFPNRATGAPPSSAQMPVVVARDRGRRDRRVREPLRASRRADLPRRRRQREGFHLRLSRLALRSARQPEIGRVPARRQRQGRHAGGVPHGGSRPAQAARRRRCAAWCSARCRAGHAGLRGLSIGPEIAARIAPRAAASRSEVIGRFTQVLPNNWKLYVENVRDTYHASLLHLFFATFRITRLSQGGGVIVSANGGHHASTTLAPAARRRITAMQGMRSDDDAVPAARSAACWTSSTSSATTSSCRSCRCFRASSCSRSTTRWRCGRSCRAGWTEMDLHWTYLGFADDTPELRALRLRQGNLVGPGGFRFDGGRLRRRLRPARRGGGRRGAIGGRDGRRGGRNRRKRARPRPRCAASGSTGAR